jgi:hypothetical protein
MPAAQEERDLKSVQRSAGTHPPYRHAAHTVVGGCTNMRISGVLALLPVIEGQYCRNYF